MFYSLTTFCNLFQYITKIIKSVGPERVFRYLKEKRSLMLTFTSSSFNAIHFDYSVCIRDVLDMNVNL